MNACIISLLDPQTTWCGADATVDAFKTLDHAAVNGLFIDTKQACTGCVTRAVRALLKNIEVKHDE